MNFRTQVELPNSGTEIHHSEWIMLWGSCFAENIGTLLVDNKFSCDINPFGILYNPLSIAEALMQIMDKKVYQGTDLFFADGLWHSWMHHSKFSNASSELSLKMINERLAIASAHLGKTDWMIFTWGTAYAFFHKDMQTVVGNCHKQSEKLFERKLLQVYDIVEVWQSVLQNLKDLNPRMKFLFTVSPIRHVKDGMHGNQLSKSTLLLAVDELCRNCSDCHYFPSYEIMMDELRDYRFYKDDMLHPTDLAVEYIWKCFSNTYFGRKTISILQDWGKIRKELNHKPYCPESEAYRKFISQLVLKIMRMKENLPYLEVEKELELCESRLKM